MLQVNPLPVGAGQANCYIVSNKDEALIIDPGADVEKINEKIEQLGVHPIAILLTHTHYDHIGAVDDIRDRYNIPVYVAPEEQAWLEDSVKNLSGLLGENITARKAEHLFQPPAELEISEFTFTVVATPGHSPGGVSFIFEEDDFVITGDALFAGSIGRTDLPGSKPKELLLGIRENLFTLPEHYTVYPGHGERTTIAHEMKTNPFFN